ncbi:GNAT family N-acetyltransferase [Novosphingobium sp. 1949]|uniref:GNAT family N-acetyltransferase n=1 Tax=Novosphingobium organovorum TaxID=2930092 RepID=A0ABT0BGS9_9SPHN|nr:GNAT family N-acetyltransferase [Novosphingobium organovorum]MCJ2184258.1 GNAT family N-acetyltransferase [Novosphingobium organovorum]
MAEEVFETERLRLRRERPGDRAAWLEHINTPEVMAHLGGPCDAARIDENFASMAQAGELPFRLIERKADAALIGKCGLSRIAAPGAPAALKGAVQLGWTLRADCWGQGYAREAAGVMIAHAFEALGCAVVYAQTSQANQRSWRLMERLGMVRRPDLDYEDPLYPPEENPTIVFALTREDAGA